jgi:hypothetical protein
VTDVGRQAILRKVSACKEWPDSMAEEIRLLGLALKEAARAVAAAPAGRRPFHLPWKDKGMTCKRYADSMREATEIVFRFKTCLLHHALYAVSPDRSARRRIAASELANTRQLIAVMRRRQRWDAEGHYTPLLKSLESKLKVMIG